MVATIDNCVGCEICLSYCQWHNPITIWTCDWCDEDFTDKEAIEEFEKIKGKDVCPNCYRKYEEGILDETGGLIID